MFSFGMLRLDEILAFCMLGAYETPGFGILYGDQITDMCDSLSKLTDEILQGLVEFSKRLLLFGCMGIVLSATKILISIAIH